MPPHLDALPSLGYFSRAAPPAAQHIRTDPTNILIRALELKRKTHEESLKGPKPEKRGGKEEARAESHSDGEQPLVKRAASSKGLRGETVGGSSARKTTETDLHDYTVEKLKALLREKGLSSVGKKEVLLERAKKSL
eukprot:SM000314S12186  [mRNA]  locus=s314:69334:70564:- [translate_table: standard]